MTFTITQDTLQQTMKNSEKLEIHTLRTVLIDIIGLLVVPKIKGGIKKRILFFDAEIKVGTKLDQKQI